MTTLARVRRVDVPGRVALVAVHVGVRAVQRESRCTCMIVAARCPTIRRVALRAIRTEVRLRVVRFHRAGVLRHVARVAVRGCVGVACSMTLETVNAYAFL